MNVFNTLKCNLHQAKNSFSSGRIPDNVNVTNTQNQTYNVWGTFKQCVTEIIESQTFHGIRLLVPSERGRVTRSGTVFGCDKAAFKAIINNRFNAYGIYLQTLISELQNRFEPWPQWLHLSDIAFNFSTDQSVTERQNALKQLMECHIGATPLMHDEKLRISAEYITFQLNAESAAKSLSGNENKPYGQTELWYELLSKEKYYKDCKQFNSFAVKLINCSLNEGVVEVEVSNLENISTKGRPLKHETTEKLNFIASNGPHPLVSFNLVDDFLNAHFGKNWHFTIVNSKWLVSQTVDRHFKEARNLSNSLA